MRLFPMLLLSLCLGARGARAAPARPVVAVFSVEDRTGKLTAATLQQLTDYLTAKIAEGGQFQVVPRAQLRARLVEEKRGSYRDCYDEKCQIEIGRELAAQKTISTQVIQVGTRCAVASTLYDLKRAASEASASVKTGCVEDDLVTAIERAAAALKPRATAARPPSSISGQLALRGVPGGAQVFLDGALAGRGPILTPLAVAPGRRQLRVERPGFAPWSGSVVVVAGKLATATVTLERLVAVELASEPRGAAVEIDGRQRGLTPLRLELPARAHALVLRRDGFRAHTAAIDLGSAQGPLELRYTLEPTRARHAQRSEWLALSTELALGVGGAKGMTGVGGALDVVTLKWRYLDWTLLTLGAGAGFGGGVGGSDRLYIHFESRPAFPLRLGRNGQHQLRLALGLGVSAVWIDAETWVKRRSEGYAPLVTICLSPGLDYTYQTRGRLLLGAGLRALVPVSGDLAEGATGAPTLLLLGARLGWASALEAR